MSDLQHLDRTTIAGHRPSPSAAALDVGAPTTDVVLPANLREDGRVTVS